MIFIYTVAHHTDLIDPKDDSINFGDNVEKVFVSEDTPMKDIYSLLNRIPIDNLAIDNRSFSILLEHITTHLDNPDVNDMFLNMDFNKYGIHIGIMLDPDGWDKDVIVRTVNRAKLTPIAIVNEYEEIDTSRIIELHKAMDLKLDSPVWIKPDKDKQ